MLRRLVPDSLGRSMNYHPARSKNGAMAMFVSRAFRHLVPTLVLLAGFVASHGAAKTAGDVAKGISGVKQVHNFITLQP
jgi:BON domain